MRDALLAQVNGKARRMEKNSRKPSGGPADYTGLHADFEQMHDGLVALHLQRLPGGATEQALAAHLPNIMKGFNTNQLILQAPV